MRSEPWYRIPKLPENDKSAVVIGGGLAGTSAAYSLSKRGWNVTLIERESKVGQGASGNPLGIITPLISHKTDLIGNFYLAGFNYTMQHLDELNGQGGNIAWEQCGVVELGSNKIGKNIEDLCVSTSEITKINCNEVSDICGANIASNALYMPKCGWIDPQGLCSAHIKAAKNIKTIFSKSVLSLNKNKGRWSVKCNLGTQLAAAQVVVIANANDAVSFSQCSWLPLQVVAGQLTYLPKAGVKLNKILCYDGGYVTPEINGHHYLGATFRRGSSNRQVTMQDHQTNLANLKKHVQVDDVDVEKLEGRVSIRATTPDRRPIIGAVPDFGAFNDNYADLRHGRDKNYPNGEYLQGLYISAGYGSRGLTAAPIGGELLAAMIDNDKLPLSEEVVNLLNPARFIIRSLKRGNI